ncbi:MAG: hypothetical protein NTY96_00320 [Bacteroidetes bacterium]|nr:hypothetical protein [Bacteroidota bacterium]
MEKEVKTKIDQYWPGIPKPYGFCLYQNMMMIFQIINAADPNFAITLFKSWSENEDLQSSAPKELKILIELLQEVYDLHDSKEIILRLGITESEFVYWLQQGNSSFRLDNPEQNNELKN